MREKVIKKAGIPNTRARTIRKYKANDHYKLKSESPS